MDNFSFNILLEFLYNKFAITLAFCFFGSFIREYFTNINTDSKNNESKNGTSKKYNKSAESKKDKKKGGFNLWKVIISAIFSTFLMCASADYIGISLHFELYAVVSIILGMWGFGIIKCIMDEKFIANFCANLATSIANPIVKSVVNSASKASEDSEEKTDDDNK